MECDERVSFFCQTENICIFNVVPLVTNLIGGDFYAIELVYNDLGNATPVVIIDVSCSSFVRH
jgi:hypothetical protein